MTVSYASIIMATGGSRLLPDSGQVHDHDACPDGRLIDRKHRVSGDAGQPRYDTTGPLVTTQFGEHPVRAEHRIRGLSEAPASALGPNAGRRST